MTRYFYNHKKSTWLRMKGSPQWIDSTLKNTLGDYKEISFWQYYLPRLFPLTQEKKEVQNASSSDQAGTDHQTYDPDLAVG